MNIDILRSHHKESLSTLWLFWQKHGYDSFSYDALVWISDYVPTQLASHLTYLSMLDSDRSWKFVIENVLVDYVTTGFEPQVAFLSKMLWWYLLVSWMKKLPCFSAMVLAVVNTVQPFVHFSIIND